MALPQKEGRKIKGGGDWEPILRLKWILIFFFSLQRDNTQAVLADLIAVQLLGLVTQTGVKVWVAGALPTTEDALVNKSSLTKGRRPTGGKVAGQGRSAKIVKACPYPSLSVCVDNGWCLVPTF